MPPAAKTIATRTIAAVAFVVAMASAASAQDFASLYSSTAPRNCKQVDAAKNGEGAWTIWLCAGIVQNTLHE